MFHAYFFSESKTTYSFPNNIDAPDRMLTFAHATSAFGTPGVVLFGASTPKVWGHSNNINLYKDLRCAPCIDLLFDSPCPYGKPCMTTISVGEVREALIAQLTKSDEKEKIEAV
jgi:hypothetical protein